MRGIVINLLKDVQLQDGDINHHNRLKYSNLVWTHYDRISIEEVKDMEDYFILSDVRNEWVGGIQSLHLYSEDEKNVFTYSNNKNKYEDDNVLVGLADNSKDKNPPSFFCITSCKLNIRIKNIIEWTSMDRAHDINDKIKRKILDLLEASYKPKGLYYEIYNSLGAEDFVIIFACNSMEIFANAIESIRKLQFKTSLYTDISTDGEILDSEEEIKTYNIFETTYSFAGQNSIKNIKAPNLNALVSITFKSEQDKNIFIYKLKNEGVNVIEENFCFGEYDVRLIIESSEELMKLYLNKGLLSATSEIYRDYIYQSQTVWLYKNNQAAQVGTNVEPLILDIAQQNLKIIENSNEKTIYENSSKKFERIIKESPIMKRVPHFKEECRILLAEYKRYMYSSFIQQWWTDIELQFDAFVESLEPFLCHTEDPAPIKDCMEDLKETYMHITQASRMFFEVPEMTTYYSGSYNNILRAYYGLIRLLISIGYAIPHEKGSEQSKLAFSINFDMTPKINSKLHLLNSKPSEKRLISFNLPYDALYNMPKYMIYLIHEVFHYISPINRIVRNRLLFKICLDMVLRNILYCFVTSVIQKYGDNSVAEDNKLQIIINNIVSLDFGDFIQSSIEGIMERNNHLHKEMFTKTSEFFNRDLEHFFIDEQNKLHTNIIDIVTEIVTQYLDSIHDDYTIRNNHIKRIQLKEQEKEEYIDRLDIILNQLRSLKDNEERDSKKILPKIIQESITYYENGSLGRVIVKNIQELCEGLSEAICDMYIINLLGLSFEEYIDILIGLLDELLFDFKKENNNKSDSLSFRIGILIDLYNTCDIPTDWLEDKLNSWKKIYKPKNYSDKSYFLKLCYDQFTVFYTNYKGALITYLNHLSIDDLLQTIDDKKLKDWTNNIAFLQTFYKKYKTAKSDGNSRGMLKLNIEMIEFFQSQLPIHTINLNDNLNKELQADIKLTRNLKPVISRFDPVITELDTYMDEVTKAIRELKKNAEDSDVSDYEGGMWFRGVCNSAYGLTPSIFRNIPDNLSLYAYQVALLKETHASTASYPHLWNNQMTTCIEQIGFMQHYGVPTNLLDFSLDALTSLHFAANPDNEDDRNNIVDAAVYILHPALFNKAMMRLNGNILSGYYPIVCSSILSSGMLEPFIPSDCSDNNVFSKQKSFIKNKNRRKYIDTKPKAIIVPRTNDRIHVQKGTFVAFPLDVVPFDKKRRMDKKYNYLDLIKLQEEYLDTFDDAKPFLKKIVISASYLDDIRKNLKLIGITSNKLYPELDNLLKNACSIVNRTLNM